MSPELKDLLTDAAREPRRVLDVEDIHRRGRRSRTTEVVAAVAGIALVLGGVAVAVDRLGTGAVDAPIVGDPDGGNASETPTPDRTALRTISAADMDADVLLSVDGEDGDGHVMVLGADGSIERLAIDAPAPSYARIVPDGEGGFSWQPVSGAGGSPPILHVGRDGTTTTVVPATTAPSDTYRLVGGTGHLLLVEHRSGEGFDTTADLLEWWAGGTGSEPRILHEGVGGWEAGVTSAANVETTLYAATDAGWAGLIVAPPTGDPVTVWEGGEGEGGAYPVDVAIGGFWGYALVDRAEGDLLFTIMLHEGQPRVTDGWPVPIDLGDVEGDVRPAGLSAHGDYVLVNRQVEGRWLAPLVYETTSGRWYVYEREGRALLAAPATTSDPEPACAQDDDRVNQPPSADAEMLDLYLMCFNSSEHWDAVFLVASEVERSGDPVVDARAILDRLFGQLPRTLTDRGYSGLSWDANGPAVAGGEIGLHDIRFADGTLTIDFDFPEEGVGVYSTSAGSMSWHLLIGANLLAIEGVERLVLMADGTCDYGAYFEGEPQCGRVDDAQAPWAR